jgi:tetratricopeptide (TPR) repeat protein
MVSLVILQALPWVKPLKKGTVPNRFWRCVFSTLAFLWLVLPGVAHADAYGKGVQYYSSGLFQQAVPFFLQALQQNPDHVNCRYYLADTYVKLNQPLAAQQHYQKILVIDPGSQAARLSRLGLVALNRLPAKKKQFQPLASKEDSTADQYRGPWGEGSDYLDKIRESGRLIRWSLRTMPLKVYVEERPVDIRNFQPAFASSVRKALDVWTTALDHQLGYQLTTLPEEADIRVFWTNRLDTRGSHGDGTTAYTAGIMLPKIRDNQIDYMTVQIATFDIAGHPQTPENIYAVAIHEIGHSLGLMGHSDNPADIMYGQNKHVLKLSKRDINTFRRLYSSKPDISNLSPKELQPTPDQNRQLEKQLIIEIQRAEQLVQKQNFSIHWLNLGVLYFQQSEITQEASSRQQWLAKALKALQQAEQLEPEDAKAKHRISLAYQAMGDFAHAEEAIQKAINLAPKEADYLMLHAWYLAKLDRKAEARGELDRYLREQPGQAGSRDVQQIRKAL